MKPAPASGKQRRNAAKSKPCAEMDPCFNMLEFTHPIPVLTPLGGGYAIYVRESGTFENDIWAVALEEGGHVRHFRSDQITLYANATFDITKEAE